MTQMRIRSVVTALASTGVVALVTGCDDGTGVSDDRCTGRIGDPSIATSCAVVEGRVVDQLYQPLRSANVRVDCFGPATSGCGATPVETDDAGRYRLMVHELRQEGTSGFLVVHAHHRLSGQHASSDTVPAVFVPMGTVYRAYIIDLRIPTGSSVP